MQSGFHSVTLDYDKCIGCTDCIKRCPTEAIRVRNSKASIINERCIDCGMCIRVCNHHAKKAVTDSLESINQFKYKVAIPAPTLYTQFHDIVNPNVILTALKHIGFDEVFEVSKAADIVTQFTKEYIKRNDVPKPLISSACPAIVKLIQINFPSLIPNIMPIISPKEAIARYAKSYLVKQGMKKEDIGVFFISPCAAKVTNSRINEVVNDISVDGVIAIKDIYLKLHSAIRNIEKPEVLLTSTSEGISWAETGGEVRASGIKNHLAVDGIENVIRILELIEDDAIHVDFVEVLACVNGCLGGPLTVENSFLSSYRMKQVIEYTKSAKKRKLDLYDPSIPLLWDNPLSTRPVMKLDPDMFKALEKMERLECIFQTLPQIDCGSCGAPTCHALAEDVVRGNAHIEDCVFMLRNRVRNMAEEMVTLAEKMPPSIRKNTNQKGEKK